MAKCACNSEESILQSIPENAISVVAGERWCLRANWSTSQVEIDAIVALSFGGYGG